MLLGLSLSVSWICLLFSSTTCFPATKDYRYPSSQSYEPVHYDAAPSPSNSDGSPGLPGVVQPAGGADGSFYDFSNWMPSQPFPDFRAWSSASASASNNEMPQTVSEVLPMPPSSYIIQSRNGYIRAREVMSNTQYSPDFPEPPPFPVSDVGAPSKSGPGGVKV